MSKFLNRISRRGLMKMGGSLALAPLFSPAIITSTRAASKQLRILQWNHFVPAFDDWFNTVFIKEWGQKYDTEVIVDNVGMTSLKSRAETEVERGRGHDLVMFQTPPAAFEDHVIDHSEIYQECERLYGKPLDMAVRNTFNPKTNKYYGFSDSYVPDPVNYRADLWGEAGVVPDSWDNILIGGRKIKKERGIPVGIGIARELDTNMALRTLMSAFGASIQTAEGIPNLKTTNTLEAVKYMKALYQETMTDEVFSWDPSSNNRMMLAGQGSLTLNAISVTRTGETQKIPVADDIHLARPAAGPVNNVGLMHLMSSYVIWNFAQNIDGAKQFLVDMVGQSRRIFLESKFYNLPCFPEAVPDLKALIADDPRATPVTKYNILEDADKWTVNAGYPGYGNAALDEIFTAGLIPKMFADAASGRLDPQESIDRYAAETARIFDKWHEMGRV